MLLTSGDTSITHNYTLYLEQFYNDTMNYLIKYGNLIIRLESVSLASLFLQ